jgi:hypothetical protein
MVLASLIIEVDVAFGIDLIRPELIDWSILAVSALVTGAEWLEVVPAAQEAVRTRRRGVVVFYNKSD